MFTCCFGIVFGLKGPISGFFWVERVIYDFKINSLGQNGPLGIDFFIHIWRFFILFQKMRKYDKRSLLFMSPYGKVYMIKISFLSKYNEMQYD